MKKLLITIILTLSTLVLNPINLSALTLSPGSGTFPVSGNKTINITSNSNTPTTTIQIRLIVNNAKVVSFSGSGGNLLSIGVCDSNGSTSRSISTTKYEVCVDLASTSSPITNGTALGSITVASLSSSGGTFTIEGGEENGYVTGSVLTEPKSGVLGSYVFGTSSNVTVLPNTALSDYMPSRGILGGAILISGIVSLAVAIKIFLLDKRRELL